MYRLGSLGFILSRINMIFSLFLDNLNLWWTSLWPPNQVSQNWLRGEFRPFINFFIINLGIIHNIICSHTNHQNGVVECKHRHIVHIGLTLLSHAYLPLKYWDHAFITVLYLINRLPFASINKNTPYFSLFGQHPDYQFFKVFRCACFPLLRL